ncbi:molybdopterin molybdenumtransferase MoeA [Agromyces luteolus]|uniref:molybdopterin molybdotransferase MoeA n=1 Tax=Agromyces luteolus TaxID=88373 RepID=UPI001412AA82|nr:molybdopterin molybdotransferase MoeA [Agromyces luteolus]GLK29092.1 molybdopterin molybdenumtransferase MoeA [Agromyces luteolus]
MSRPVAWGEARALARSAAPAPSTERVPLAEALGRVLAEPLVTAIPLPHFASAAMDGWAVCGAPPWRLRADVADDAARPASAAGVLAAASPARLEPGEAVAIVTGAPVPPGAEAVLRVEAGRVDGDILEPIGETGRHDVEGRRHIRPAGAEAAIGDRLLDAGVILTPPRIALAAATGADDLAVRRRPRVALILTGDEVVESGVPASGEVRDSFRVAIPAALRALGAEVVAIHRVGDDDSATRVALTADDVDLVVTTGGTGRSSADHVRTALAAEGADLVVPGLAARPGGPTLLARLPGAGGRLVLGLPGNPLAALLGLVALGAPLLSAWTGTAAASRTVAAARALPGRAHSTGLVPATVVGGAATPAAHLGSGMLRGLAAADVVLVVPPAGVAEGGSVEALPLPWSG